MSHILTRCIAGKGFRLLDDLVRAVLKGWNQGEITQFETMPMRAFDTHCLTIYRDLMQQSPYYIG
jgi:hypothetical protein